MVSACYLAMTAAEFASCRAYPPKCAWMACQFSPAGSGLSSLPRQLPEGAMVILSDQAPMAGHNPQRICRELEQIVRRFSCAGILLDLQRPGIEAQQELASLLVRSLPCPVGVAESYAAGLDAPVFLPPVPLRTNVENYLMKWQGREIWLDIAPGGETLTLTQSGLQTAPLPDPEENTPHADTVLHCHYRTEVAEDFIRFHLLRNQADLALLITAAQNSGATRFFGLWQELGQK